MRGLMKKAIILLSGGMDSSTLLHYVKLTLKAGKILALSFDYGQRHSRELAMAGWQAKKAGVREHRLLDMSFMRRVIAGASALTDPAARIPALSELSAGRRRQPPTYVPNRNMILLAIAAAYAEANGCTDVFYGAHAQDRYGYWDCTPEFIARLNRTLALNRKKPVVIHAPFAGMSKAAILKIGMKLRVDYRHTWTCYRGGRRPCGTCPTCAERVQAFLRAGLRDPLSR